MSSVPPNGLKPGELERNRILNDIVENIEGRFAREFKLVDYGSLKKEVLTPVIKKEFNPEVQLRGLLRSFRRTLQFQKSFANIGDPTLKERITAFIEDKPFDDAVRRKDFKIADRIKHLEYLLPITKKLFICVLRLKDAVKGIFTPKNRHVKGVPVIWEDEAHTKAIKVICSIVGMFSLNSDNYDTGAGYECQVPKLGAECAEFTAVHICSYNCVWCAGGCPLRQAKSP